MVSVSRRRVAVRHACGVHGHARACAQRRAGRGPVCTRLTPWRVKASPGGAADAGGREASPGGTAASRNLRVRKEAKLDGGIRRGESSVCKGPGAEGTGQGHYGYSGGCGGQSGNYAACQSPPEAGGAHSAPAHTPSPCLTVMPGWAGLCQRLSNGMGGLRTREKENAREAGRAKALDAKKMGVWSPGFEACEPGEGCLHLRSTREGRRLLVGRGP